MCYLVVPKDSSTVLRWLRGQFIGWPSPGFGTYMWKIQLAYALRNFHLPARREAGEVEQHVRKVVGDHRARVDRVVAAPTGPAAELLLAGSIAKTKTQCLPTEKSRVYPKLKIS